VDRSSPDGDLLRAYAATRWLVAHPDGELTLRVGHPAPAPLHRTAVVTAYNPRSRPLSAARNRLADAALRRRLRGMDLRFHSVEAVPEGSGGDAWREPGYAVRCTPDVAVALGRRYGQNAILWVVGGGWVQLIATRPGFCGAAPGEVLALPAEEEC